MATNDETEKSQHFSPTVSRLEGVRVDNTTAIAFNNNKVLDVYKERLLSRSYEIHETKHFVVCQQAATSRIVLLHTFQQSTIDADLICFIEYELAPFGFLHSTREFGATLFAIMASTFPSPRHQPSIWRRFCLNTLEQLREQLANTDRFQFEAHPYITPFAAIYQRVKELFIGESFLDIGCSFGFLPLLMEEQMPVRTVMGCDNNPDMMRCAMDMASSVGSTGSTFCLHDVLSPDITNIGYFDTVVALHVLEHLHETDLSVAFEHLLSLTARRLIIAVPFEDKMETLYGHQQLFTPEKLRNWGAWCLKHCVGIKRYRYEEVMGGMLIIDR